MYSSPVYKKPYESYEDYGVIREEFRINPNSVYINLKNMRNPINEEESKDNCKINVIKEDKKVEVDIERDEENSFWVNYICENIKNNLDVYKNGKKYLRIYIMLSPTNITIVNNLLYYPELGNDNEVFKLIKSLLETIPELEFTFSPTIIVKFYSDKNLDKNKKILKYHHLEYKFRNYKSFLSMPVSVSSNINLNTNNQDMWYNNDCYYRNDEYIFVKPGYFDNKCRCCCTFGKSIII